MLTDRSETLLLPEMTQQPNLFPSIALTDKACVEIADAGQIPRSLDSCRQALNWEFEHHLLTASEYAAGAERGMVRKSLVRLATGDATINELNNLYPEITAMLEGASLMLDDTALRQTSHDRSP